MASMRTIPVRRRLDDFASDVRAGLSRPGQKELPSKYLYDAIGSALFEVIRLLPEYGLARAGDRLLERHAGAMVRPIPGPVRVAELGSGSGRNTRWLLEALAARSSVTYHPIDLSGAALAQAERELDRIDCVTVVGFEAEYLEGLCAAAADRDARETLLVLFLGGTIGNFDRPAAGRFLRAVRERLLPGDRLLLSTDLDKPAERLLLAYDDPAGVTAAFDLNLLARVNRELDGDFVLSRFRHLARWDARERRVEMHLFATAAQSVRIGRADLTVRIEEGETIWTESSHKFRRSEIAALADALAMRIEGQWIDGEWPFAHTMFVVE